MASAGAEVLEKSHHALAEPKGEYMLQETACIQQHLQDLQSQLQNLESLYNEDEQDVADVAASDSTSASAARLRQDLDTRLKAKIQELAQLKQKQIVTKTVKSLEQLHVEMGSIHSAANKYVRSDVSSTGGAGAEMLDLQQHSTISSSASGSISGSSSSSSSSSGSSGDSSNSSSSNFSTRSESSSTSSNDVDCNMTAAAISFQPSESENTTTSTITTGETQQNTAPVQESDLHSTSDAAVGGSAVVQAEDRLQEAAMAAAAAALTGISIHNKKGSCSKADESLRLSSPLTLRNRQFTIAVASAVGCPAADVKTPRSTMDSPVADSPPSTSTAASSRSTSAAPSSSRMGARQRNEGGLLQAYDDKRSLGTVETDGPPPGFGPVLASRGRTAAQHPVAATATSPAAEAPPGFAAESDPPPGFAGTKHSSSSYLQQCPQVRISPSSPSGQPASHGQHSPAAGRHVKAGKVGRSRLFQGALAGATAERKALRSQ